ncbi:MAG: gliding motility-associated C-terminal domain-containing protein [Bacteroidota bacterium]
MMKRILLSITPIFLAFSSFAQNICLGTDETICAGDQVTLEDCGNFGAGSTGVPYTLSSISYNPDPFNTTNTVNLGDDQFSGIINIGFNFCFYGQTYNQLVISSNNYISFDLANAGGYSPWSTVAIPDAGANQAQNAIMGPWQDVNPSLGGTISYETYGTAPNRRFVITWDAIPMFSCTGTLYSSQIKIFEGSNEIETHIVDKQVCPGWNGGLAVHGVHSPGGTDALTIAGRNNTQWSVANEGYLWTPQLNVEWVDTQGNTWPYTGPTLTVTPVPTPPSDSVGYFLQATDNCGSSVGQSDTSWITVNQVNLAVNGTDDLCTQGAGEATAVFTGGSNPYSYQWDDPGNQTTQTATGLFAGTYNVTVTDAIGCQASASVTIGDTPMSLSTTNTLVSCPGGSDGTATVTITPTPASATYDWYDAGNQATQTATGLAAGTYNVAVETGVGCQDTATVTIDEVPPLNISVVNTSDATCNSASDGSATIQVTDGTPPYTYDWTGSSSTTASATDLAAGTTTVTVTDDNGCAETVDITIDEPAALQITALTQDTIICEGDDVMLEVSGSGGSSAYDFTWTNNGATVGTGNSIVTTPSSDNAEYCVTLSEQCGSPSTDSCVTVGFPDPVPPSLSPSTTGGCYPVEVTFDNTTNTNETIDYTVFDYNDGTVDTISGLNSATHEFGKGLHDVTINLVSDRGCSYKTTFTDFVEGFDYPEAAFYVNPNPATVFEPTVDAFSQSGNDIISYQWIADGAEPSASSEMDPSFTYPEEVEDHDLFLIVENSNGCTDTLKRTVRVQNDVILYAPNTFTPDGDAFNENWRVYIEGIDVYNFQLEIYNRWGELIFESHDPDGSWDGTYGGNLVKDGTYIWKIRAVDQENDNKYEFKGFVNVLR